MNISIRMEMLNLYYRDRVKELGFSQAKLLRKIWYMFCVIVQPDVFRKMFKIVLGKYVYVRQVEAVMTTKCSLKCRDCANLMQYYRNPYDIDFSMLSMSLCNFLDRIDEIGTVVLVGGEPFLSLDMKKMLEMLEKNSKVNHIDIFTNGTILPSDETMLALKGEKVKVIISDYGEISKKKIELVELCKQNGINAYLKTKDLHWGMVGDMKPRNRSKKALNRQFRHCNNYCRSILNGKLFYCPRAGHGMDLEIVKTHQDEYVNLMKEEISSEDILRIVYSRNHFSACDYCNYGTKQMINICPGVQLTAQEKKELCKKQFNLS